MQRRVDIFHSPVCLLFAPLLFWAPTAAEYLNDTLAGALVIGFATVRR